MAKTKAKKKPKQKHLPGMDPPSIKSIDNLADQYVDLRNERMELLKQEIAKRDLLMAKMKEHGLKSYEYDGKLVELVADEKVKVKSKKAESEDDEAFEESEE